MSLGEWLAGQGRKDRPDEYHEVGTVTQTSPLLVAVGADATGLAVSAVVADVVQPSVGDLVLVLVQGASRTVLAVLRSSPLPSSVLARASGSLALTASFVLVPGMTSTLALVAGQIVTISVNVDLRVSTTGTLQLNAGLLGQLFIGGVDQNYGAFQWWDRVEANSTSAGTAAAFYRYVVPSSGSYTFETRARHFATAPVAGATFECSATHSQQLITVAPR